MFFITAKGSWSPKLAYIPKGRDSKEGSEPGL